MNQSEQRIGVLAAIFAYLLWGFLPLYWKQLEHISPGEVLAYRIIWSLVFMLIILAVRQQLGHFIQEIRRLFSNKKQVTGMIFASIFISMNWFVFIWAVTSERMVEASLGYYINPLINVLLAMIFLGERFNKWQGTSIILALIGVSIMTLYYGVIPYAAFLLAITFGLYGLLKKLVNVGALIGLTIETLFMAPFALIYVMIFHSPTSNLANYTFDTWAFLIGAGAATAIPLLLFSVSAKRISLSLIGFLQYIGPTLMLILGVFLYNEPFSQIQLIAFVLIWLGLFIFTTSKTPLFYKFTSRYTIASHIKEKEFK
ncbi:EamA family transporter RarD [Bacillus sp. FJAT-45037]|uniref:EamA family transporter RarD n=1 Tax=Bacillus sp. FJAT-45037 TaxID=2011007 RepID=UPI000C235A86|nr:EamA family transporter RarD [Bacillus sp. FJAT-45037]